jgi:uncharacterized damage-inducible protein DinB
MTVDEAKELFGYASWASARIFAAAEALTEEQLEAPVVSSFPSIRATLAHLVASEWIWLQRWQGVSPKAPPEWARDSGLAELKARLAEIEAERGAFLDRLTDADLEAVLTYHAPDGLAFSHPLGDLLRHVVNHSTYHRGQTVTLLRQQGHQMLPNTDFVRYLREGKKA